MDYGAKCSKRGDKNSIMTSAPSQAQKMDKYNIVNVIKTRVTVHNNEHIRKWNDDIIYTKV